VRATVLCFGFLDFVLDNPVESPARAVFSRSQPDAPTLPQGQPPEDSWLAKFAADQDWNLVGRDMAVTLGPNLSQELFCFVAYATFMLVSGLHGEETLSWDAFKLCYDSVYPEGQTWLPCVGTAAPTATGDTRRVP
jgi:hypothetical protein